MRYSILALLVAFLLPALPSPASAQYMYLDTNGDGFSTAADVVAPVGPTTLDVWLHTDVNRDGSPASCPTGGAFTISAYQFVLHARNGTLTWSGFMNQLADYSAEQGSGSGASESEYYNGRGGPSLSPGLYRLASVTVEVAAGSPSIDIVPAAVLDPSFVTSFASVCPGNDFDNTLKLGSDWFDTDGAGFGGAQNQPPVLAQPGDMTVAEGAVQEQPLHATDAEGDAVSFSLASGPSFATATTTDPGTGTGSGVLHLAPGYHDVGTYGLTVEAKDLFLTDRKSLAVTVTDVNTAPVMAAIPDQTLREGDQWDIAIGAADAQGDPLTFSIRSGPHYASLRHSPNYPGLMLLHLEPGYADAGTGLVTVSVSDGELTDEAVARVEVLETFAVHNEILCALNDLVLTPGAVNGIDLHAVSPDGQPIQFLKLSGPDFLAVQTLQSNPTGAVGRAVASPGASVVGAFPAVVAATDGITTAPQSFTIAVGPAEALPGHPSFTTASASAAVDRVPQSLAVGDLDGDGILDAVTANLSQTVTTLRGTGRGTFERRQDYPIGRQPYSVAIGDLNEDGRPDLAVVDSSLHTLSVVQAIGGCQFGRRLDFRTGGRPAHVALGDWNADGHLDACVSNEGDGTISILLGHGNGTFDQPVMYRVGEDPCYASSADFDHDGKLDLAVANEASNSVSVLLGRGDGTFADEVQYLTGLDPRAVEIGDFNEDGNPDFATCDFEAGTVSIRLGSGRGTFSDATSFLAGVAPWSLALDDWNDDGHLDVATANVAESNVAVLYGNGAGSLERSSTFGTGVLSRYVRGGDLNGDGHRDLIVACEGSGTVATLLGNGNGTFGSADRIPLASQPSPALAGDWNRDGIMDLLTLDYGIRSLLGSGGGRFHEGPVTPLPSAFDLVSADWNGDGTPDLAATTSDHAVVTLFGAGDGSFMNERRYTIEGRASRIQVADLDADGHPDLVAITTQGAILRFLGQPDGSLRPLDPIPIPGVPLSLDLGDVNGDGRPDIAVGTYLPDQVVVLRSNASLGFDTTSIPLAEAPGSLLLVDVHGDGILDLVAGLSSPTEYIFYSPDSFIEIASGLGQGVFGPFGPALPVDLGRGSIQLTSLDANGDGRVDLAASTLTGARLFLGLGNGDFGPAEDLGARTGIVTNPTDLTGDGRVDLALSDFSGRALIVCRNLGTFPTNDRPPVVSAPTSVQAPPGVRLEIRVTASDPDGEGVASLTADLSDLPAGHDAAFQTTENRTAGTLTWTPSSAGGYDVRFTASNDLVGTATTHIEVASPTLAARAFLTKDEIPLRLNTGRSAACFRLEPVSGSFELTALDPASFTLRADSSGAGAGVDAVVEKSVRTGDRDGNGEDEISICFPRSDLAAVLGDVPVVATVPVAIEGALVSGERVRAEVDIAVKGGGTFPRVRLAPNPMNPAAVFTIETSRAGALRLALFDVSGRLVRMLVDQREAPAGMRDVIFDGRSTSGSSLASGIYFFRVESPDGIRMGRITLLR